MSIEFCFDEFGGFFAANTAAYRIEYAYPDSDHAATAVKSPAQVADEMVSDSRASRPLEELPEWLQERWQYMRGKMLKAMMCQTMSERKGTRKARRIA